MRLRIEHSGFSTLNNQRFGSKFVGDVANPTDMLLFSKKQTLEQAEGEKNLGQGSKQLDELLAEPIDPDENEGSQRRGPHLRRFAPVRAKS